MKSEQVEMQEASDLKNNGLQATKNYSPQSKMV